MQASRPVPSTADLLISGGDARIAPDAVSGLNRYGCAPVPDPALLALGSCTATPVSVAAYAAADQLRQRLPQTTLADEAARIGAELLDLCGLSGSEASVELAASGTDLHRLAAESALTAGGGLRVVMAEAAETGSGVPEVLRAATANLHLATVALRQPDGSLRPLAEVDAEFCRQVAAGVQAGSAVLLILTDSSKSGVIAPSPACALILAQHNPALRVLVDACQFRLSPATVRTYLAHGFEVALTGSKFVGGPSFSGALLRPRAGTPPVQVSPAALNWGVLLRWEAALTELRAFRGLPEVAIADFLREFAAAVQRHLAAHPQLLPLALAPLMRPDFQAEAGWDTVPTVFPFQVCNAAGERLGLSQLRQLYQALPQDAACLPEFESCGWTPAQRQLAAERVQLGQPVQCGTGYALRLCASARLVVAACAPGLPDRASLIARTLRALDKVALLAEKSTGAAESGSTSLISD